MNKGRCKRLLAFVLCVSMIGSMAPVQTKAAGAATQANDSAEADTATSDHYDANGFCKGYEIDPDGSGAWVKKTGDDACTDDTCNGYQSMTTVTEDGTTWYEISNAGQLYWFADQADNGNLLDANVRLTADIVDNEGVTFGWDENNDYAVVATKDGQTVEASTLREWNPIGVSISSNDTLYFAGHFDGQGHIISGLYYNKGNKRAGIFQGVVGTEQTYAIVERVGLENSYLYGNVLAGAIVAWANYAEIKQCYNSAYLVSGCVVGGIVAQSAKNIKLNELYNAGEMRVIATMSFSYIGQIVGSVAGDEIESASSCYERSDLNINFYGNGTRYNLEGTFFPMKSFYNGEVAYLLSQSFATWGQDLSSENSLPNPCASEKYKVYKACTGYTNDESKSHHSVVNGFCTNDGCDYYEEPHYNEAGEVYEISNAGQLYAYADKAQTVYTKGARLTADIVVNEETLIREDGTPVTETDDLRMWDGMFRTSGYPYYNEQKLVFDGNNHSISGLYAKGSGLQGFALHNYGTVKNLQIKNSVFISTDSKAGGIDAGYTAGPADYEVENCSFEGYVEGATDAGGIVGGNHNISNCYVDAYVNGETVNPISPNGKITNTAYNIDKYTDGCTTAGIQGFTTDQFASGEVAYALNHAGSDAATDTWKQNLDGESKDSKPTLNEKSSTVYRYNSTNCAGNDKNPIVYVYTNDVNKNNTKENDPHTYESDTENLAQHKCNVCDATEDHTFTYKKADNDNAIIATCSVCDATYIVKLTKPAAASDGKLVYDGTAKEVEATIESGNTGKETISENAITYAAVTDAKTSDYSTTVPKDAGTYKAKLTLGTGDNAVSIETEFTIEQATPVIAWAENQTKQSATYTGEEIAVSKITAPKVVLLGDDAFSDSSKITYSYRKVTDGTASGDFISGLPTELGTYAIKASIPAEGNYTAAETADTMQLTIVYLEGALDAVVTDKNDKIYNSEDWCPSDIVLKAPAGYKISVEVNGDYQASCTYTGTTEKETITYYLKADDSGEIAEKSVAVKMDRTAPDWGEDKEELGIHIRKNWWNSLLGTITFGVYKGTLDVYIQANDSGIGVTEYDYYIDKSGSTTALTAEELDSLAAQNEFEKVEVTEDPDAATKLTEITADDHYVIYAYAVDAAGNKSAYISSDGVVLDNTAPVISDVEKPTKEGKTLTDTTAAITFTGSEAGTCYYILHESEDDADANAPKEMGDFAEKEIAEEDAQVDTWNANNGVATQELTGDANNTIKLTGLKANTSYVLYLAATDAAGNASAADTVAAEGEDSGIVSVAFTTAKTVPYVQTAPVLSGTYGDTVSAMFNNADVTKASVTAGQNSDTKIVGTWTLASEDADEIPAVGTSEKYILTFTPTGSDAHTYDAIICEVTPEVSKKQLTVEIADKEKSYGETNPALTWSLATGDAYADNVLVTDDTEEALGISLSTTAEDNSNVGTYAITGLSDSANYEVSFKGSGSDGKSGVLTVKQATNSFTTALSCSDYMYAKDKAPQPKAAARFGTVTYKYATYNADGTYLSDEAYTDTIPVNVGSYLVKAYVAETENYTGLTSDQVPFCILQQEITPNSLEEDRSYTYAAGSDGEMVSIDLADKCNLPEDRGSSEAAMYINDADDLLDAVAVDADFNLTYKVKEVDASKVDKTAVIGVAFTMQNYKPLNYEVFVYSLTITITDKKTVEIKSGNTVSVDGSDALTYGDKLSKLTFGSVTFVEAGTDTEVKGTLEWTNPDNVPVAGTTEADWVFRPTDSKQYAELTGTAAITVAKATPTVVTVPTVAERVYNPDAVLTDSDMTGGSVTGVDGKELAGTWSFTETNIIPTVNNKGYRAVFTPTDIDNYNTVTETISVKVTKATPVIAEKPEASTLTYGQTLSDSTLTGGKATYNTTDITADATVDGVSDSKQIPGTFAWKSSAIKPTVADSGKTEYDVIFTPSDADNYNAVDTKLTLTVNKAAKAPNMPQIAMTPAHSTAKVGDVTLPERWSWSDADKDKELADGVEMTATAVYVGEDKGNYETESVTITITRSACTHETTELRNAKESTCTPKETGTVIAEEKSGVIYKVTNSDAKNPEVEYTAPVSKETKKVVIPDTVTIDGVEYAVTSIAKSAFKNNKKLTEVKIGKNVTSIGDNAFAGCKNLRKVELNENLTTIGKNVFKNCKKLKTITIKSTKLNKKNVKKGAFKGITAKTVIKVPKSKLAAYKKLFRSKGLSKKVRFKKY